MPDYPNGTPSWVELNVPDPAAAAGFYGELFGWSTVTPGSAEETGGYQMFVQDGKSVAGLMKTMQEGQPTAWATYISVDSAQAAAAAVAEGGGTTMVEPMDVMDIGRAAFFADPSGAVFGVWEPKAFAGAELVNTPNSLCWNEVLTRDAAAALEFYPKVFGWSAASPGFDGAGDYKVWQRPDGHRVGGCMQMSDQWFPPDVPSHWAVTFAVADTDALVAKAPELGGTVTMPAMDCPIGRFAGFVDPQGATFAVMTTTTSS